MATILKVHGTFASGPEEGDKWWQRGSECCNHVGELVEAEDGNLKIEQVIWDGLNSERSRQAAATKLLDRMGELEKAGEPYCVVGHSHGGSVISAALLRAAFYKKPLEKLSRWITIGTPFIEAKRSRLLFARLGMFGKTIFLSIVSLFLLLGLLGTRGAMGMNDSSGMPVTDFVTTAIVVLMICYGALWLLARHRLHWHNSRVRSNAQRDFAKHWLSLRHPDDEAVQGLGAFQVFKNPIFPPDFAVNFLARTAILLVPIIMVYGFYLIDVHRPKFLQIGRFPVSNPSSTMSSSASHSAPRQNPDGSGASITSPSEMPTFREESWADTIVWALVFPMLFLGIPIAIYHVIRFMARPTSHAMSYGLNRLAWSQLRSSSLGSDVDGESAQHALSHPVWIGLAPQPLPSELSKEISTVSDAAAAKSIASIRAALSELSFYSMEHGGKDALNAFLCGDELIHTTYFKIPRFRKLLAYSIAQSPGFRPSPALLADPDFPLIEQWYKELTAPAGPVVSQNQPASPGAAVALQAG